MIAAAICLSLGLSLLALSTWNLRTRAWDQGMAGGELFIARLLGEDPWPRTPLDRRLARLNIWGGALLGLALTAAGAAILYFSIVGPE